MKEKPIYEQLGYDPDPPFYAPTSKPIVTNYNRIISKTPEKLAEFMAANTDCYYCIAKDDAKCASLATTPCGDIWLDWLRQEAQP